MNGDFQRRARRDKKTFLRYQCKEIEENNRMEKTRDLFKKYRMEWGGGREEGSGWGTHIYLWQIHFDIWQNQYNIVKLNKILKKG